MQRIALSLCVCYALIAAGCSSSSTSGGNSGASSPAANNQGGGDNSKNLLGKWEPDGKSEMPPGSSIEFSADGKIMIHLNANGKQMSLPAGTYKLEGDKVTLKKDGPKPDTEVNTIKSLTNDSLILVDPKGKEEKFKRVK